MKITFFSNFLNHHQTPFCDEMYKQLKDDFTFVSTMEIPNALLKNGYPDYSNVKYNLKAYVDENNYSKALQLGLDSDIVITGSAPEIFIEDRLKLNKPTFRYSERFFKRGIWRLFDPRVFLSLLCHHTIYRKKNLYMLCASAYTANDLNIIYAYPQKKFKWGYFTKVEKLNIEEIINQKYSKKIEILWTARFIDLKHPELAIKLAYELKKRGYDFHLNMIGTGDLFSKMRYLINKLDVADYVTLLGSMPNAEVRNYMKKSNIFLFTSDRNEGWGAVLNEAMSCGCAVVASNTIGAVPYLIKHKVNGLIFKSGSLSSLLTNTYSLFKDRIFMNKLGENAYATMANTWSPKNAASNFLLLAKSILDGKTIAIENGPCSKAVWTKNNFEKNKHI